MGAFKPGRAVIPETARHRPGQDVLRVCHTPQKASDYTFSTYLCTRYSERVLSKNSTNAHISDLFWMRA